MVIDIHSHTDWHGMDAAALVRNMDGYGIDKAWLLTWEAPEHEIDMDGYCKVFAPGRTGMPFDDMLRAVDKFPDRLIPGYAPDPRDPRAIDKLDSAIRMYGVKVYGELKVRIMLDDPDALLMYQFCGEKNLPVLFHIDVTFPAGAVPSSRQWWYCYNIDNLERALTLCPQTSFIGHGPGFWREISGDNTQESGYPTGKITPGGKIQQLLDKYPNLYCDLSAGSGCNALSRDPAHAVGFLTKYQDKIMYGRDSFDNSHQETINSLGLPDDVLKKIYSANALSLVPSP